MPETIPPPVGARLEEIELQQQTNPPYVLGKSISNIDDLSPSERLRQLRSRGPNARTSLGNYPDLDQPFEQYAKLDIFTKQQRVWVTRLIVCSFLDMGISFMVASISLSTAYYDMGLSLYCIGFQAIAHLISSVICILRFWKESRWGKYGDKDGRNNGPNSAEDDYNEEEEVSLLRERKKDFRREQILSIVIGVILLMMAAILSFKAARKFKFWDKWHKEMERTSESSNEIIHTVCEVVAWKSGGVYTIQAIIRYFARLDTEGHKFTNHLFWVSFMSCLFCYVLGISASWQKEWSWKAEPIAAGVLAVGACIEGMRILYVYFDDADDIMTRHARP